MKKRILALVLAAIMVVSILPVTVFATGTYYAITNGSPEDGKDTNHGYITIDKTSAEEDDTVTITVNPAECYQLKTLKYNDGTTDYDITTDANAGEYQFTMPGYAVTVTAEFEITIADILPSNFPASNYNNSWCNSGNDNVYIYKTDSNLVFYDNTEDCYSVPLSTPLTKEENPAVSYVYSKDETEIQFNMTGDNNDKLENIVVNKCYPPACIGTYYPIEIVTYDVTYHANGATSGSAPTDSTKYASGASVTVLGNTGNLTKEGYTFDGWNTRTDGTGDSYAVGSTFSITKNTTLYAKWASVGSHVHKMGTIDATDDIAFEPWTSDDSLPNKGGSYYLTKNVTLTTTWSVPTGTTTDLCLNGHVIKMNGSGSVINVPTGATLNLYDCDTETKHYFDKNDNTGLWTLKDSGTSDYVVTGGVITGGVITGVVANGGGVLIDKGTFNMYGGNIVGNTSTNGGGVYVSGKFAMEGGNIVGNTATSGGGVYVYYDKATFAMEGGTITGNTASSNGGGVYVSNVEECLAAGTLITLADGTRTVIENLKKGDMVRVFDHETGKISSAKLFDLWKYPAKQFGAFTLHFTHGIDVTAVGGHCFFDKTENRYAAINTENVNDYIGHEFYNVDGACWETLTGVTFLTEAVDTYIIVSEKHMNVVAGGMLSNEDGIYTLMSNIFDFGENLTIDAAAKAEDIAQYDLWDFENVQHVSQYVYDALNLQYMSVAFGKGLITPERFAEIGAYSAEIDPELLCSGKEAENALPQKAEAKESLLTKIVSFLTAPFVKTAYAVGWDTLEDAYGVYFGGTAQVVDNKGGDEKKNNNVYLYSTEMITLGTGDNGVATPTNMSVGVTMQTIGKFADASADEKQYFFADKDNEYVEYKESSLALAALPSGNQKIMVTPCEGGKVIAASYAKKDVTVPVTVTPDEGYKVSTVSYTANGETHPITKNDNAYTFTMPDCAVTISATFKAVPPRTETVYWGVSEDGKTLYLGTNETDIPEDCTNKKSFEPANWAYQYAPWNNNAANTTITAVEIMSKIAPTKTAYWFYGLNNLSTITGLDKLDTSYVTDMSYMFKYCKTLASLDLSGFDTSKVTDMSSMFESCEMLAAPMLSEKFTTAEVTNMKCMFQYCKAMTALDLSDRDMSQVTDMSSMFYSCENLETLKLNGCTAADVTNMKCMFYNCKKLAALDLSGFDTTKVTDMSSMFRNCNVLATLTLSENFKTDSVTKMERMFDSCKILATLDVSKWDTSKVTNMSYMFYYCNELAALDVSMWNTSNVTDMNSMFAMYPIGGSKLTTLDVSKWNTSKVTDMSYMFYYCNSLAALDVSKWDTSKVTNMSNMFSSCSKLAALDVSGWKTPEVTNMSSMFYGCSGLTTLGEDNVKNWDTAKVTTMGSMFSSCSKLAALNVSDWKTSNVTSMSSMFYNCSALTTLDMSKWNTSGVTDMSFMFMFCSNLKTLDLSSFNASKVTTMKQMFGYASSPAPMTTINTPKNIPTTLVSDNQAALGAGTGMVWFATTTDLSYTYLPATDTSLTLRQGYTITKDLSITNGSVTVQNYAANGDTVTITVTPNSGYRLKADSLKVYKTGESTTTVNTSGSGNTRTFTMLNYAVTASAAFEVIPKTTVTINATAEGFTYGEAGKTGYKDVSVANDLVAVNNLVATYYKDNGESADPRWTKLETVPTDAGNYKVELSVPEANETYTGSKKLTFTIAKRPVTLVAGSADKVYDGYPLTCTTFTVKENITTPNYGFVPGEDVEVVPMTGSSLITDVGTATNVIDESKITAKDGTTLSNYDISTENGTLTVTPAAMTITATRYEGFYDGEVHLFEEKDGDEVTRGGISCVVKDAKGNVMDASEYELFVREKDKGEFTRPAEFTPYRNATSTTLEIKVEKANFTSVTTEATFKITKAPLTVTAKAKNISYGDAAANDGVEYSEFVNGETTSDLGGTLTYAYKVSGTTTDYTTSSPVGTYDIIPSGLTSDNYEITFVKGTLTVGAKAITKPTAVSKTYTYTGTKQTFELTGFDANTMTISGNEQTNANETGYTVTVTPKDNYAWSTDGDCEFTWVIGKKVAELQWTTPTNLVYSHSAKVPTVAVTNLESGDSCTVIAGLTVTNDNINVGTFTFTATALSNNNYTLPENVTSPEYTVAAKAIMVSGITAENKVYDGNTAATLVYTGAALDGLISGEELAVTATGAFADAYVGTGKTVNITGITLTNVNGKDYLKNYVLAESGNQATTTADITKKNVTVTITPNGGTYAGTITGAAAQFSGLVSGESFEPVLTYSGNGYNSTNVPTNAGTYTVTATLPTGASNYNLTGSTDKAFTIAKANGAVAAPTAKKLTYNGQDQALVDAGTSTTGEVKYAVSKNTVTTAPTTDWNAEIPTGKDADTYRVWYKAVGDSNHNDTAAVYMDVTITKKVAELQWTTPTSLVYSHSAKVPTVAVTNLESGDSCTVDAGLTAANDNINVGKFTFTVTALTNDNYTLPENVTSPEYTITRAAQTLLSSRVFTTSYDGSHNPVITLNTGDKRENGSTITYEVSADKNSVLSSMTLTAGQTYYVRKGGDDNYEPSNWVTFTVPAQAQYTVRLSSTGGGSMEVKDGGAKVNNNTKVYTGTVLTLSATPANNFGFTAWYANDVKLTGNTYTVTGDVTLKAVFTRTGYDTAEVPTPANFTYDGNEHTGFTVPVGAHYTAAGTLSATNAGAYSVTFTLNEGCLWEDGTAQDKILTWKISKATQAKPKLSPAQVSTGKTVTVSSSLDNLMMVSPSGVVTAVAQNTITPDQVGLYEFYYAGDANHYPGNSVLVKVVAPITVKTQQPTDITKDSAVLHGTVTGTGAPATVNYEYGKAGTNDKTTVGSGSISGLTADTEYSYRAFVTVGGKTYYGETVTFRTAKELKKEPTGKIDVTVELPDEASGTLSVESGNTVIRSVNFATSENKATATFDKLPDGYYNVVLRVEDYVETRMIAVANGQVQTVNFFVPEGSLRTIVEIANPETPKVAVEGLGSVIEAQNQASDTDVSMEAVARGEQDVEVSLSVEKNNEAEGKDSINYALGSGEKLDTLLDISLLMTVSNYEVTDTERTLTGMEKQDIGKTNQSVLEIVIPYNTNGSTAMYRYHDGISEKLTKLSARPVGDFADGTYYVDNGYIFLYASGFSTYAIAETETSGGGHGGSANVISAPTGDAGLALYAALSVSSVLGMGWVGKKKRDEE